MEGEVYSTSPPPEAAESESLTCPEAVRNPMKTRNKNRRRFSEEQIRSLESIFESDTKLDPRRKLQLARELGLQPRQVAIWFQNRRARWKSKEIEQSYRVLKANYDSLYSQFECLKKENQLLLTQLQDLNDLLEKGHDQSSRRRDLCGNSTCGVSDSGDTKCYLKTKTSCLNEGPGRVVTYSDEERNAEFFQQEKEEFLNMIGQVDGSLRSHDKGCNLDSDGLFDQSCGSSNWWDFWTWKTVHHSPER